MNAFLCGDTSEHGFGSGFHFLYLLWDGFIITTEQRLSYFLDYVLELPLDYLQKPLRLKLLAGTTERPLIKTVINVGQDKSIINSRRLQGLI